MLPNRLQTASFRLTKTSMDHDTELWQYSTCTISPVDTQGADSLFYGSVRCWAPLFSLWMSNYGMFDFYYRTDTKGWTHIAGETVAYVWHLKWIDEGPEQVVCYATISEKDKCDIHKAIAITFLSWKETRRDTVGTCTDSRKQFLYLLTFCGPFSSRCVSSWK